MGPTASGKTDFACELFDLFPAEIISVDSAMVFRTMDIGTAKPSAQTLSAYPHHIINCIDPCDSFSVQKFRSTAMTLIEAILKKNKTPILVGGTMLYFKALTEGLTQLPTADQSLRAQLNDEAERMGRKAMHDKLKKIDPITAKRLHQNDQQRVQRALEVFIISGIPLSEHFSKTQTNTVPFTPIRYTLFPEHRSILHERIENRFHSMIKQGFIDEVACLKQDKRLDLSKPSMRCVGYRQVWSYLNNEYDQQTMINKGIYATRQLAKRQLTWLRSIDNNQWFNPENNLQKCTSIDDIISKLNHQ